MAELEHNQIEIWRAEAVKNWMAAALDTERILEAEQTAAAREVWKPIHNAIVVKIRQLLGIADDLG